MQGPITATVFARRAPRASMASKVASAHPSRSRASRQGGPPPRRKHRRTALAGNRRSGSTRRARRGGHQSIGAGLPWGLGHRHHIRRMDLMNADQQQDPIASATRARLIAPFPTGSWSRCRSSARRKCPKTRRLAGKEPVAGGDAVGGPDLKHLAGRTGGAGCRGRERRSFEQRTHFAGVSSGDVPRYGFQRRPFRLAQPGGALVMPRRSGRCPGRSAGALGVMARASASKSTWRVRSASRGLRGGLRDGAGECLQCVAL